MTYTRVQSASNGAVTASFTLTLPNTPTQGNLLVACATSGSAITNPTGWTVTNRRDAQNCAVMYHKIAGTNESKTLTLSQSSNNIAGAIVEYAGNTSSPLDVAANTGGTNDTGAYSIGPTSVTTTADSDLIIGAALIRASATAGNPTAGSWTGGLSNVISRSDGTTAASNITNYCFVGDDLDGGAAGTHSSTASWSTTQFKQRTLIVAGFKADLSTPVATPNPPGGFFAFL